MMHEKDGFQHLALYVADAPPEKVNVGQEKLMANGAGKNWVRVVTLVIGFRQEFGVWPTELLLPPWLIQNLEKTLSPVEVKRITSRLQLTPQEPGMVACDRNGHRHTYSITDATSEETESAVQWLGGRPDWSHSGDPADKQANQASHATSEPAPSAASSAHEGCRWESR